MFEQLKPDAWVSIWIAMGSVVIVPFVVHAVRDYLRQRRALQAAELLRQFLPREEHSRLLQELKEQQERQHLQNVQFLDTIRMEGNQREGRILGTIESISNAATQQARDLREEIGTVSGRVDDVLKMLGNRRRE